MRKSNENENSSYSRKENISFFFKFTVSISKVTQNLIDCMVPWIVQPFRKVSRNLISSFWVILLTDRQDRQVKTIAFSAII